MLRGARRLLRPDNFILVEAHSPALHDEVTDFLRTAGLSPQTIRQSPLPLVGRENRDPDNCWVVAGP